MNMSVGVKIGVGYVCALALLAAMGVSAFRQLKDYDEHSALVSDMNELADDLSHLVIALEGAGMGVRGYLLTNDEGYLDHLSNGEAAANRLMTEILAENTMDSAMSSRLPELQSLVRASFDSYKIQVEKRKGSTLETAAQDMKAANDEKTLDTAMEIIAGIVQRVDERLTKAGEEQKDSSRKMLQLIVYGTGFSVVILLALGIGITLSITRPVQRLVALAEAVAAGNLAVATTAGSGSDEISVLTRSLNQMVVSLRGQIKETLEGVGVLASSASEISSTVSQLAASASETASSVSETTTTVEEVRKTAEVARDKARVVADGARETARVSQSGEESVRATGESMTRIREQVESVAASMVKLSEQGQAIGSIIATVDDIAEQSNLLAVNAAIEAAKAGEHGKGFAVVAQEVKNLAEQSKQATAQVRGILSDIQRATGTAVMATEQAGNAVNTGTAQAAKAGQAIQALAQNIREASEASAQISVSTQQQFVGVDQVTAAMETIKQASEQNVEGTRQMEIAARNLDALGRRLHDLVARYKV